MYRNHLKCILLHRLLQLKNSYCQKSKMISIAFVSLFLGTLVNGYGSGPPATQTICTTMFPGHGWDSTELGYAIAADIDTFNPGSVVTSNFIVYSSA